MASIYLETSFISALVTDRTDVASAYRREVSREWWDMQAPRHSLFISAEAIMELSHPAFRHSQAAVILVRDIPLLAVTEEVQGLATILVGEKVMPAPVGGDAVHVAVATIHRMDYMLTWNVRHLANLNKTEHLRAVCLRVGLVPPRIVTPDLLWESADE
jgi:hypothetical protein